MKYAIAIFYLTSFTAGFANLSLIALSLIRRRRLLDLFHGLCVLFFMCYMLFWNLHQIVIDILGLSFFNSGKTYLTAALLVQIPLLFVVPRFLSLFFGLELVHDSLRYRIAKFVSWIYYILAAIWCITVIVSVFVAFSPRWHAFALRACGSTVLSLAPVGIVFSLIREKGRKGERWFHTWGLSAALFLALPFWAAQNFWQGHIPSGGRLFDTQNLFFLIWNLASCVIYMLDLKDFTVEGAAGTVRLPDVLSSLSDREREIALLAGQGKSNKDIATILTISPVTVKNHIYNIYQKTGIQNRFELIEIVSESKRQN